MARIYTSSFRCPVCNKYAPITQKSKRTWGIRRHRCCKGCKRKMGTYQLHDDVEQFDCWLLDENRNSTEYRQKRKNYKRLSELVKDNPTLKKYLERARIKCGVFKF